MFFEKINYHKDIFINFFYKIKKSNKIQYLNHRLYLFNIFY